MAQQERTPGETPISQTLRVAVETQTPQSIATAAAYRLIREHESPSLRVKHQEEDERLLERLLNKKVC